MAEGNPKIDRGRFHLAAHQRQDYVAIIPHDHSLEMIEQPGYWSTIANQCKPFGRIEARAEDGSWIAEFLIKEVGRQFITVARLQLYRLTTEDVAQTQVAQAVGYSVLYRGQHELWGIKRLSDDQMVHSKEATRDGAAAWLKEHLKALAR